MRYRVFTAFKLRFSLRPVEKGKRLEVRVVQIGGSSVSFVLEPTDHTRALVSWLGALAHGAIPPRLTFTDAVGHALTLEARKGGTAMFVSHRQKDSRFRWKSDGSQAPSEPARGIMHHTQAAQAFSYLTEWMKL